MKVLAPRLAYMLIRLAYTERGDLIAAKDDNNELHDPVKYLNMYGTGFCDDAGNSFCSLNWHANFTQNNYGNMPK